MANILLPALVTIIVFVGVMYVLNRGTSGGKVRSRMVRMAQESGAYTPPTDEYGNSEYNPETAFLSSDEEKSPIAELGESVLALFGKDAEAIRKEKQLLFVQAGIDSPNALGYYYAFRVIGIPVALLFAYLLLTSYSEGMMKLLEGGVAIFLVFMSWFGPNVYLTNKKQKRQKLLQRSFPDTLDLILVCVESGLALDAALARVCRELGRAHPEITKELNRTRMELTLLSDRSIALQNLAERTDLVAFRSLVAALMQTERFGTSLTETLRVLSDDYRHTRLMIAENKAGRLPAMMTIPMILLMMPAFVMIILGPAIISVLKVLAEN